MKGSRAPSERASAISGSSAAHPLQIPAVIGRCGADFIGDERALLGRTAARDPSADGADFFDVQPTPARTTSTAPKIANIRGPDVASSGADEP